MEEEEADWGSAWTVVGGRSARHQQVPLSGIAKGSRVGVSHEASVRSQGVWIKGHHRPSSPPLHLVPESVKLQEDGLDHATKECTVNKPDLSHLIGAPVFVGGAKPARDTAPPPASRRPAGLLKVDMRMVTGRGGGEEDQRREEPFDLSAENWPGIGVEGGGGRGVVGDVTSYSRVVKTAPPTRQRPPPNHNDSADGVLAGSSSDSEGGGGGGGGKKKKKRRKKNKSSGQLQESRRDRSVQFALGDLFTQLHAETPSNSSVQKTTTVYGGVALPVAPKREKEREKEGDRKGRSHVEATGSVPYNMLDSSAPVMRRGKEREQPKKKKQTAIRKIITKEKEEKKRLREAGLVIPKDLDVMKKEVKEKEEKGEEEEEEEAMDDEELIPVTVDTASGDTKRHLHNRRFRDYCDHMVTEELNECITDLMTDLVRFQDRVYKNEPLKLKTKRRYVCGLREVRKALVIGLRRVQCVLVPPNLDRIQSTGGIDDQLAVILEKSQQQNVPVVFCLSRRRLAWVLKKKHAVGCAAIFSYAGAEDKFHRLMSLVEDARESYRLKQQPALPSSDRGDLSVQSNVLVDDSLSLDPAARGGDETQSSGDEEQELDCNTTVSPSNWRELFSNGHQKTRGGGGGEATSSAVDLKAHSFTWNPNATEFTPRSFNS